jgi:hypothetical protein
VASAGYGGSARRPGRRGSLLRGCVSRSWGPSAGPLAPRQLRLAPGAPCDCSCAQGWAARRT